MSLIHFCDGALYIPMKLAILLNKFESGGVVFKIRTEFGAVARK